MMVKVSLIIPVFNSQDYLKKCVNSAINQTYGSLEIILINDGSTDSSPKIINEYAIKDDRIVAIHKENGGIGSAYKAAFEVMTGDYVLFVDSDDWLELNAVESLVRLAIENDADMVSFGIRAYNIKGEEVTLPNLKISNLVNTSNEAILKTHFEVLKHPTLVRLYKRNHFKDIVVLKQNIGIDEMITPQLLKRCHSAVYTSDIFYNILVRQDSVCRSGYTEKKIKELIKVNRFVCHYMESFIPSYASTSQFKYLSTLFYILHQASYYNEFISDELLSEVRNDLRVYYNRLRKETIFRQANFRFKFAVLAMNYSYLLYRFGIKRLRKLLRPITWSF